MLQGNESLSSGFKKQSAVRNEAFTERPSLPPQKKRYFQLLVWFSICDSRVIKLWINLRKLRRNPIKEEILTD